MQAHVRSLSVQRLAGSPLRMNEVCVMGNGPARQSLHVNLKWEGNEVNEPRQRCTECDLLQRRAANY